MTEMTDAARLDNLELGLTKLRTELQQFRLEIGNSNANLAHDLRAELREFRVEAARDNAELASGIKADMDRLAAGQAEILTILRQRRRWWPFG